MRVLTIICILSLTLGFCQQNKPKDYFIHPLDIPLATSGTFGELRSNHFHSGLDLRTNGEEGLNVYAAASGNVSRIKISNFGYGKAIYIVHPNGYTSVYAHLKKFSPTIEAYIKKRQYAKESYEIQLYPKAGNLQVNQGDIIGYSGNTGGSGGPHLHFEIRNAKAQPMNPLAFDIKVADTKKPIINSVWVYSLDKKSHSNGTQEPTQLRLTPQNDGSFKAEKIEAIGVIGVGVSTIDQQNLSSNKNGIYAINTTVNGAENFRLTMDKFSFSETRYINRLIDYSHYKLNRNRISKLFIESNNPLSIYNNVVDNGRIKIKDSMSYTIKVFVKDFNENTTTIHIPIEGKSRTDISAFEPKITPNEVKFTENFTYTSGIFNVFIPKGSLYENAFLEIETNGDTIHMHRDEIPLHKKMTIVFDVSNYTAADKKKLYVGQHGYKGNHFYTKTYKKEKTFSIKTKTFGSYSLFTDTVPPVVVPINFSDQKWISDESYLKLKIDDVDTGIDSYEASINGKFILMEYDYKTGMLVYDFNDKIINISENKFKLNVLDKVGNNTTFESTFYRKP